MLTSQIMQKRLCQRIDEVAARRMRMRLSAWSRTDVARAEVHEACVSVRAWVWMWKPVLHDAIVKRFIQLVGWMV